MISEEFVLSEADVVPLRIEYVCLLGCEVLTPTPRMIPPVLDKPFLLTRLKYFSKIYLRIHPHPLQILPSLIFDSLKTSELCWSTIRKYYWVLVGLLGLVVDACRGCLQIMYMQPYLKMKVVLGPAIYYY